jgi:hypothetical protein
MGRSVLRPYKGEAEKERGHDESCSYGLAAIAYSLGFASGLVWVERYHSKVRAKPSSKLTSGS